MLKNKILATTLTTLLATSALAATVVTPANASVSPNFPFSAPTLTANPIFPGQAATHGITLENGLYIRTASGTWAGEGNSYSGRVSQLTFGADASNLLDFPTSVETVSPDFSKLEIAEKDEPGDLSNILKSAEIPTNAVTSFDWEKISGGAKSVVTANITKLGDIAPTGAAAEVWNDLLALTGTSPTLELTVPVNPTIQNPDSLVLNANTANGGSTLLNIVKLLQETTSFEFGKVKGQTDNIDNKIYVDKAGKVTLSSGVPEGTYNVPLIHKYTIDEKNVSVTYNLQVVVNNETPTPPAETPAFVTTELAKTFPSGKYDQNIEVTPTDAEVKLKEGSTLPSGLALENNKIVGTVASTVAPGTYNFNLVATKNAVSTEKEFTIVVEPIITTTFGSYPFDPTTPFSKTLEINSLLNGHYSTVTGISVDKENSDPLLADFSVKFVSGVWVLEGTPTSPASLAKLVLNIELFETDGPVSQEFTISFEDNTANAPVFENNGEEVVVLTDTVKKGETVKFPISVNYAKTLAEINGNVLKDLGFDIVSEAPATTAEETAPVEGYQNWFITGTATEKIDSDKFTLQATALTGETTTDQDFKLVVNIIENQTPVDPTDPTEEPNNGNNNNGKADTDKSGSLPITGTTIWATIIAALLALTAGAATMLSKRKNLAPKH